MDSIQPSRSDRVGELTEASNAPAGVDGPLEPPADRAGPAVVVVVAVADGVGGAFDAAGAPLTVMPCLASWRANALAAPSAGSATRGAEPSAVRPTRPSSTDSAVTGETMP